MKISIFIPTYNASLHIESVVERIPLHHREKSNIYIINDGSTDDTDAVLLKLSSKYQNIKIITFRKNQGYGAAVKAGLEQCDIDGADYAVCIHSDGQYPPEYIDEIVSEMIQKKIDLMQGSRIASGKALSGGMPIYKYIAGKILTAMENMVLGLHLTDYHSGYLIYSRKIIEKIDFKKLSNSFDFDLQVIVASRALKLSIAEFPIPTRYADEISYLNPIIYGFRVLKIIIQCLFNKKLYK